MKITLPGHGRCLVRCLLAVLFAGSVGTPAWSQDADLKPDAVFRGQSPWIVVSQETAVPAQSVMAGPPRIAQLPSDPFGQPYSGGTPGYGEPGLPGMFMDTPALWQPYAAAQGKFGTERSVGIGQLMMPLYQDGRTLLFADIRGRIDDASNTEGNLGLAVRTMIDPEWLVGLYGFFDYRRTEYDNNFSQGTVGVEAMSVLYEARLNGYIPEAKTKAANSLSTAEIIGNNIFVKGGFERAYYGLDGEIGALLWDDRKEVGMHEIRAFVGGYWFDSGGKNFPSIAGPKGRLELRAYDVPWFGPQSRLTLGVELQHDNIRDFQVSGIARLEIPLGFFQNTRRLTRLERRMLDRIIRDDDIITVTQQGPRETGIDSLTNRPLVNVNLVDKNTAGGIPAAVTAAGPNSIVIVDGHAGAIATATSINVQQGQVFRGGGFQVIGAESRSVATFGTRPTINNTDVTKDTVVLAKNSTVADLNLTGGRTGIFSGAALTGVLVSGNTVSGAANHGLEFSSLDSASIVQNSISQSNANQGFFFGGVFSGTAQGNVAAKNTQNGFGITSLAGTLQGNTATENGRFGIGMDNITATGSILGNTANQNVQGGIAIFPGPVAGTITGNTANNNGRDANGTIVDATADGFRFDGAVTATIDKNTALINADHGFVFNGNLGATARVMNNLAHGNDDDGFEFASTLDAGSLLAGNISTGNGRDSSGVIMNSAADGFEFNAAIAGTVTGNSARFNADDGFDSSSVSLGATGVFSQNIAVQNGAFGFHLGSLLAGSVFNTNTAVNNTLDGFQFNTVLAGTVNGNTATGNGVLNGSILTATANGFALNVNNTGTFTNNLAIGNANNGFAGNDDANFTNAAASTFSNNIANKNGDKGYRGVNAGTAANNTGTGNINGGDAFP